MYQIDRNKINTLCIGYGELALKGKNRKMFEDNVKNKLKDKLKETNSKLYYDINKLHISIEEDCNNILNKINKVFGINNVLLSISTETDEKAIKEKVLEIANDMYLKGARSFKIEVNRANKLFPKNSMDFSKELGAHVLINSEFTKVSMKEPDLLINVDIRDKTYIFTEKIKLYGGMPLGSSGVGLSLISGGIDSPVASFVMSKRGLKLHYATFHSFPYTSQMAIEKVKDLVKVLSNYNGKSKLYTFNILPIQEKINESTNEGYRTILIRRAMVKLSEMLALRTNLSCLVTGESLGQVASQTIEGITCTNSATDLPILRPLIGTDKNEIIEIAQEIETYPISIMPYQDSCEMFAPKHPITKPKISDILKEEEKIKNYNEILEEIYNSKEMFVLE